MAQGHSLELQGSPVPKARELAMNEGVNENNHALDVRDLTTKKRGFLPRTRFLEGTIASIDSYNNAAT